MSGTVVRLVAAVAGIACGVAALWLWTTLTALDPDGDGRLSDLPAGYWGFSALAAAVTAVGMYAVIVHAVEGTRRQREAARADRGRRSRAG